MAATPRTYGFQRVPGANPTLNLYTQDPAERAPYVFGLGVNDSGRISTISRNGSALTFPDAYSFGEAIELRYTFAETGNAQRQGLFLETRGNVANSATIRGAEIAAAQCGAVAIGTLEAVNAHATVRSSSTGNITNVYGVTGEANHNSACYTGTITDFAAVRGKASMEDGATYTNSEIYKAELEPVSGSVTVGSIMRATATAGSLVCTYLDFSGIEGVNQCVSCTGYVYLMKWTTDAGQKQVLRVTGTTASVANIC